MTTALQLVTASLRKLGAVAAGETPDADEQSDAIASLNQIIESWNLQGLNLYRRENASYTLVPSQQDYTIGSGGDFDGARPITLNGAFVTRNGIDYRMEVLTQDRWNGITQKSTASDIPCAIYYEPTFPLGTVHVFFVPNDALTITLAVDMQLSAVATVDDVLVFPPGYERALMYALAVDLAPEYKAVTLSQSVIDAADESLAIIQRVNNKFNQPATIWVEICLTLVATEKKKLLAK